MTKKTNFFLLKCSKDEITSPWTNTRVTAGKTPADVTVAPLKTATIQVKATKNKQGVTLFCVTQCKKKKKKISGKLRHIFNCKRDYSRKVKGRFFCFFTSSWCQNYSLKNRFTILLCHKNTWLLFVFFKDTLEKLWTRPLKKSLRRRPSPLL